MGAAVQIQDDPPTRQKSSMPAKAHLRRRPASNLPSHQSRLIFARTWLQPETAEPLLKCLAELAIRLEPGLKTAQITEAIPDTTYFDSVRFVNTMANLGYQSTQLSLSAHEIDPRLLPCLFIFSGQSQFPGPAIISSDNDNQLGVEPTFKIFYGRTGTTTTASVDELYQVGSGKAYFFKKQNPDDSPRSRASREQTGHSWFTSIVSQYKPLMWQLLVIGFLINAVALSAPLFLMLVYDRIISTQDTSTLPWLAAGIGLALVAEAALRSLRTRILSWLTARINYVVGTDVFSKIIELPPNIARHVNVTAQLARIRSFESVRDFFSGPIFVSAIELPSVVIALMVLAFFSPLLAAIPVITSLAFAALFFGLRRKVSHAIKVAATNSSITQRFCIETFQEMEDIRVTGLADVWKEKYRQISGRDSVSNAKLLFLGSVGEHISHALSVLACLAVLVIGVELVWSDQISIGMLVAAMILIWRAMSPFYTISSLVPRFEQFRNSVDQLNKLMELDSETEARQARAKLPSIHGDIGFEKVTIRHSRDAGAVFSNFNLQVKAGQVIAVIGAAGSGKSTILNLVQAVTDAHLGKVAIDGYNVRQLLANDLRRQISHIPQTVGGYPGTIAENLRTARPDASDQDLWVALKLAGAVSLVRSLPNGLEQELNSVACRRIKVELLYGIAFARVYLQDARILLIDEIPAPLLNSGLERTVTDIITRFRGLKTIIFVTQRSDHMRLADKVVGLRHGQSPIVGSLEKVLGEPA